MITANLPAALARSRSSAVSTTREQVGVAPGRIPARRRGRCSVSSTTCRPADADGIVEAGDAAGPEHRDLGLGERVRVRLGLEVDLERRQHVDDERALDEVDGARGVGGRAVGEEAERGEVEHREADAEAPRPWSRRRLVTDRALVCAIVPLSRKVSRPEILILIRELSISAHAAPQPGRDRRPCRSRRPSRPRGRAR